MEARDKEALWMILERNGVIRTIIEIERYKGAHAISEEADRVFEAYMKEEV